MSTTIFAQNSTLEGYVFEDGNRGYLKEVAISITQEGTNQFIANTTTNEAGFFTAILPVGKPCRIQAQTSVVVKTSDRNKKVFTKVKMFRKPGYLFEVTLAEMIQVGKKEVDAITGARIEAFNNTTQQTILDYPNHPLPIFKVNFERGNHYSILIRKNNYYAKRLEAYVDIKGCILCFEGVGNVQPGVSDVLTEGNKMGTLLANISMQPLIFNQTNTIPNSNTFFMANNASLKETAKKEIDNLLSIVKDNPHLVFEIGVHTDARGNDDSNQLLTQERANNIAQYLYFSGKIQPRQLIAKGYGETQLLNNCTNGINCEEAAHQLNQRVTWKVMEQKNSNFVNNQSLAQIIKVEQFNDGLTSIGQDQVINKTPPLSSPELINAVIEYGIDTKKITPTVNPDGVALENLVDGNDIYAEITNATRLVDENYVEDIDKELLKLQRVPTNYQSPVKIDPTAPNFGPKVNQDIYNPYEQKIERKIIVPEPKLGETMVASAQNNPRTRTLPFNYTGYKIEFFTTLSALPASHEIFNRHGNIVLERKANGLFSYLLGDFQEEQLATTFLEESLLSRYSTATVISYENGQRKQAKKPTKAKTKPVSAPPR